MMTAYRLTDVHSSASQLLQSVWDEVSPELARLVRAMQLRPDRVDDVLQDVYLTAWRKLPAGLDRQEVRRWLMRVVINRCNLEHRRHARWRRVASALSRPWSRSDHVRSVRSAAETVCQAEQRHLVRAALQTLQPRQRSILVLRYFAEFDSKEIGNILQMPDSTVRSHLRAARRELALALKRAGYRHES
jgi:RNA polymerase sigma-70 factor (ECF subfamily)